MEWQSFKTVIFLLSLTGYKLLANHTKKLHFQVEQEKAAKYCKDIGTGLLTFTDISESHSVSDNLSYLNDGESAWIEGSAIFSRFLSWVGCFKMNDFIQDENVRIFELETSSLFLCQDKCNVLDWIVYIGISVKRCLCVFGSNNPFRRVDPSFCDVRCSNYSLEACGSNDFVSIYNRKPFYTRDLRQFEPGQCIYLSVKHGTNDTVLDTGSCYTNTPETIIRNYFCEASHYKNCSTEMSHGNTCLIHENATWMEANQDCLKTGGYLTYYWPGLLKQVANYTTYWLGLYRTFLPTQRNQGHDKTCLAVTRAGQSFYIETDSCSSKKHILCLQPSTYATTFAVEDVELTNTSDIANNMTGHIDLEQTNNETFDVTLTFATEDTLVYKSTNSTINLTDEHLTTQESVENSKKTKDAMEDKDVIDSSVLLACVLQGVILAIICVSCVVYRRCLKRVAKIPAIENVDMASCNITNNSEDDLETYANASNRILAVSPSDYSVISETDRAEELSHVYEELPSRSEAFSDVYSHLSQPCVSKSQCVQKELDVFLSHVEHFDSTSSTQSLEDHDLYIHPVHAVSTSRIEGFQKTDIEVEFKL